MGVIANTNIGKIEFCEQRESTWQSNAVEIGTSGAAVTAWIAQVTAARNAYEAQKDAQNAAKDATIALNEAIDAMMGSTSSIIKQVRAKADLVGDGVYALASLPVPSGPTPIGALGEPRDFEVTLDKTTGALNITWKNTNPKSATGVVYQIWRSFTLNDEDFVYLGGVGQKKFTDANIPNGTTQLYYKIQAVRSTSTGPFALLVVKFGTGSAEVTASTLTQPKIAA